MKRELAAAEEAAHELCRWPPLIEGVSADEFIAGNADPLWLHQNEMWDLIPPEPSGGSNFAPPGPDDADDIPF